MFLRSICYSHRTYCWLVPIQTVTSNYVTLEFQGLSRVELKYAKFWGHLIMLVGFIIIKNDWLDNTCSVAPFVAVLYARLFELVDFDSLQSGGACLKSRLVILVVSNDFRVSSGQLFCTVFPFSFWLRHNTYRSWLNCYTFYVNICECWSFTYVQFKILFLHFLVFVLIFLPTVSWSTAAHL